MKTLKLSFDLSDEPELVELIRMECHMLLKVAEKTFAEWNSDADQAYDNL